MFRGSGTATDQSDARRSGHTSGGPANLRMALLRLGPLRKAFALRLQGPAFGELAEQSLPLVVAQNYRYMRFSRSALIAEGVLVASGLLSVSTTCSS